MEKPSSVSKSRLKQLTTPVPPPPLPQGVGAGGGSELVAKSPPETPPGLSSTLQSRGSEETTHTRRDEAAVRVLTYGGLQLLCGVLMVVFGVLALVHKAAMGQYGAGLWGGGAALAAGLAGVMAGLRGYYHPGESLGLTALTVYLAVCLVGIAVTTLALVLTSTGLLRDFHQPAIRLTDDLEGVVAEDEMMAWAPVLTSLGLLLITVLLLVSLLIAVLRFYRQVCPCSRRPPAHRLLESPASHYKQGLVHSWLGQQPSPGQLLYPATQPPGLLVYPPPLLVEGSGLYTVPSSSIGYPQCISPLQTNPYMQRRRSPHPHQHPHPHSHRSLHSVTPDSGSRSRRQEKHRERKPVPVKEKEITDEQLAKTYTGLDREIAEEFISIAMTNSQHRPDKVIDCIAPM